MEITVHNKIFNLIKTTLIQLTYRPKIDKYLWIFSSVDNCHYNYNAKYLFEYIKKNCPDITPRFVINDCTLRHRLQIKYGREYFIETNTIAGIKLVLTAGVWLTSAGLPVYGFNLCRKHIIVNLWHGVPLKRIALLENNTSHIQQRYFKYIFSNNYSYILTTSKNLIPVMAKSFGVSTDKIVPWGQPRNDEIFSYNCQTKLYCLFENLPEYQHAILYAPTYRENNSVRLFPFTDFSPYELNKFLEDEKIIIFIRHHISAELSQDEMSNKRILFINEDIQDDIMQIINNFDLLITDYSSIFIDFLLTGCPLLFLPYDKASYIKERGLNFEYDSITPGPKPTSFNEFLIETKKLLYNPDYYKKERTKINNFFNDVKAPCSAYICTKLKAIVQGKD